MNVMSHPDYISPLRTLEGSIVLLQGMDGFEEISTYVHNLVQIDEAGACVGFEINNIEKEKLSLRKRYEDLPFEKAQELKDDFNGKIKSLNKQIQDKKESLNFYVKQNIDLEKEICFKYPEIWSQYTTFRNEYDYNKNRNDKFIKDKIHHFIYDIVDLIFLFTQDNLISNYEEENNGWTASKYRNVINRCLGNKLNNSINKEDIFKVPVHELVSVIHHMDATLSKISKELSDKNKSNFTGLTPNKIFEIQSPLLFIPYYWDEVKNRTHNYKLLCYQ